MARRRNRAKPRLVEVRADGLAVFVVHDARHAAVPVTKRDELASRRSDAHGVHRDARSGRSLRFREPLALEILAVRDEHHRLLMTWLRRQCGGCYVDAMSDVSATTRDGARIEGVDRLEESRMVEGHGALDERVPGKRDDADAVPWKPLDEVADRQLRALESRRFHVVGIHAARRVDDEEQVGPLPLERLPMEALLRACERDEPGANGERDDDNA